ncbi:MAG: indolepyruvate oxidoreductase subunit beta [Lentisphaerae bacterium]|jgi:indolepyruvate ferredoxin oxidoreductase beta subunit|nr:indolepyruvate oxidoreductase subunit beta [Lentisphaerota bacterium]
MNISLVGVGGQGILLTSEILSRTAALAGMDVKKSEIHGMAQRGGSVISQVRFGARVFSPIIINGMSDILVAFEKTEALRWRPLLKAGGKALVNNQEILPITVSSGQQPAVENPDSKLGEFFGDSLSTINAAALSSEAGNPRTANMVIAGALSTLTPFTADLWHEAMAGRIPAKLLDVNLKAFEAGRAAISAP